MPHRAMTHFQAANRLCEWFDGAERQAYSTKTRNFSKPPGAIAMAALIIAASCSGSEPPTATPTPTSEPTTGSAPVESFDTAQTTTLANGLEVSITPVADAATIAVTLVFTVGSHHDPTGQSGLAHFAEHLLITSATAREPARTVESVVAAYPLGWNAQTGSDFTILATVVDPADLATELELTAARLASVDATTDDMTRERSRILAEVDNMFGGIPALAVSNLARERLLPTPNGGRRGGNPDVLALLTLDELNDWLKFYNPSNATLSIAGPVDVIGTLELIDKLFSPIPTGPAPPPPGRQASGEPGLASGTVGATDGLVALAYAAPDPTDSTYPAFLVGATRLFADSQTLGLSTAFAPIDDPRVLTIIGPSRAGATPDQAADQLKAAIDGIVTEPLLDGEGIRTAQIFSALLGFGVNENTYGVAFSAARRQMLGIDPALLEGALTNIDTESYRTGIDELFRDAPLSGAFVN